MKKVIVIEEDDDIRFITELIINELGYIALCFKNILSIDKIIEVDPDIMLIDNCYLDGEGGILCQKLKAMPSTRDIPIILMSTQLDLPTLAAQYQADAALAKPFDVAHFNNVLLQF